ATIPAAAGAVLGTWGALIIGDTAFKRILAVLMIVMSLWTLWDPFAGREIRAEHPAKTAAISVGFFLVGIYGGFVQAGVGFLILAATTLTGLDLVRGNAIKVLSVLAFTIVSLVMFWWEGKIDWVAGLILAVSNGLGSLLGVRLTVFKGHTWVKRFVTAMIVIFALQLLLRG
ncbi:MAG TPA: sulfite exporter TauE/SafE family protein, partial [Acidobacteriota bacterium]|nr:sulfite exporter TauE/SafE family protein [Acidobacteriota bacterium]